jgi:hypothetical protein
VPSDKLLDLERLALRRQRPTAAKLLFGGDPLRAPAATEQDQAIPGLDDMPERLEVMHLASGVERLVERD